MRDSARIQGARIRLQKAESGLSSGGGGIRTHEGPKRPLTVFETARVAGKCPQNATSVELREHERERNLRTR
jgi:hypothetical protein